LTDVYALGRAGPEQVNAEQPPADDFVTFDDRDAFPSLAAAITAFCPPGPQPITTKS